MKISLDLNVRVSGCVFVVSYSILKSENMAENLDLFSLEDEDISQLFITQEPKQNVMELLDKSDEEMDMEDSNYFLGVAETDFQSPCRSIFGQAVPIYSDISDDISVIISEMKGKYMLFCNSINNYFDL